MKIGAFTRQRLRIERRFPVGAKRNRALAHLVRDARAAVLVIGNRAVGWRLSCGALVCQKKRYSNAEAAESDLARIAAVSTRHHLPVRAYECEHCGGWHVTSQARNAGTNPRL